MIKSLVSFIAGCLSIFCFFTGVKKVSDINFSRDYKDTYLEVKSKELKKICTEKECNLYIYTVKEYEIKLINDTLINISNKDFIGRTHIIEKGEVKENLEVSIEGSSFILLDDVCTFTVAKARLNKIDKAHLDETDEGFLIAEIILYGMIEYDKKQYSAYLFGKIPINADRRKTTLRGLANLEL